MAGRPKGLVVAAREGDQLETLRALRDVLAQPVADTPPAYQAPLTARLMDCLDHIAVIEAEQAKKAAPVVKTPKDQVAERRRARLEAAKLAMADTQRIGRSIFDKTKVRFDENKSSQHLKKNFECPPKNFLLQKPPHLNKQQ